MRNTNASARLLPVLSLDHLSRDLGLALSLSIRLHLIPASIFKPVELMPLLSVSSSPGVRGLYFLQNIQTGCETDQASYSVSSGGPFPGVKQPEHVAVLSPPSVVEFKKTEAIPLLPTYACMACAATTLPLLFIHSVVCLATGP